MPEKTNQPPICRAQYIAFFCLISLPKIVIQYDLELLSIHWRTAFQINGTFTPVLNFLAHIFLSGEDPEVRFGNFIGDDVKGNKHEQYPEKIQFGILLHRHIDSFTDGHDDTLEILKILYPSMGKVSSIALDIYSDHFLAKNWHEYSNNDLNDFSEGFYEEVLQFSKYMPPTLERMYYYMKKDNWLYHYRSKSKLSNTFKNMVRRYPFAEKLANASNSLVENYSELEAYFQSFFPKLMASVEKFFIENAPNGFSQSTLE